MLPKRPVFHKNGLLRAGLHSWDVSLIFHLSENLRNALHTSLDMSNVALLGFLLFFAELLRPFCFLPLVLLLRLSV